MQKNPASWQSYKIKGKFYERKRFEGLDNGENSCYCGAGKGKFHALGCALEESLCPDHPGRMIDCVCEGYREDEPEQ